MKKSDALFIMCIAMLDEHHVIDRDLILKKVENCLAMPFPESMQLSPIESEDLIRRLESHYSIKQASVTVIQEAEIIDWINDDYQFPRWDRYATWLTKCSPGFPIASLENQTKLILNHCMNPHVPGAWDVRGMVVGHVQSGKTANYVGVINRALDAGYKVIIVLAGVHNALREQTQGRIDSGVIGRESADLVLGKPSSSWVGVGELDQSHAIQCLTSKPYYPKPNSRRKVGGDFSKNIKMGQNTIIGGEDPWIFVIKKNKSVLENLVSWLGSFRDPNEMQLRNIPALIIDDEADNASVNSGEKDNPKTINRLVRALTALFEKSTFLGYTATPYANMFIPQEWNSDRTVNINGFDFDLGKDLFPGDFIVNIEPGSNYIGSEVIFGREAIDENDQGSIGLPVFKEITDSEPPEGITGGPYIPVKQTKSTELPSDLPNTLKEAIQSFVVVVACRQARGQVGNHNSMLVNVAYRVIWIDEVAYLVQQYVEQIKQALMTGDKQVEDDLISLYYREFFSKTEMFQKELRYDDPKVVSTPIEDVRKQLLSAVKRIEVRAVHGTMKGVKVPPLDLNYRDYNDDGLCVIAVGGGKLSRGLTLEDLSISYFLRTTRMYDSLMQMGRWFGYRSGYVDLCRLYTTQQLFDNFKYITMVTEEVRRTFRELTILKRRPRDFQLKVRTDSTGAKMLITSPSRMRESWLQTATFGGKVVQSFQFFINEKAQRKNVEIANEALQKLSLEVVQVGEKGFSGFLGKGLDSNSVIQLLDSWQHTDALRHTFNSATKYWRKQIEDSQNLTSCSLYIPSSSKRKIGKIDEAVKNSSYSILSELASPTAQTVESNGVVYELRCFYRSLLDKGQECLESSKSNAILDKNQRQADLSVSKTNEETSELSLIEQRRLNGPLIVMLPLEPGVDKRLDQTLPLYGLGIIFPHLDRETPVEYAVNRPFDWGDDDVFSEDDTTGDE